MVKRFNFWKSFPGCRFPRVSHKGHPVDSPDRRRGTKLSEILSFFRFFNARGEDAAVGHILQNNNESALQHQTRTRAKRTQHVARQSRSLSSTTQKTWSDLFGIFIILEADGFGVDHLSRRERRCMRMGGNRVGRAEERCWCPFPLSREGREVHWVLHQSKWSINR